MASELEQSTNAPRTTRDNLLPARVNPPVQTTQGGDVLTPTVTEGEKLPSPVEEPFQHEVWIEEFKEAGQYHRLHLQLMFGEMAVFLTATGLMLGRVTSGVAMPVTHKLALCGLGLALAVVFGLRHRVLYHQSRKTRDRAI